MVRLMVRVRVTVMLTIMLMLTLTGCPTIPKTLTITLHYTGQLLHIVSFRM